MASTYPCDGPFEVVEEDLLQVVPGVDGVWLEALQPCEWGGLQGHWEVDDLGHVRSTRDFYSHGLASEPLLRNRCLAIVLGDVDWLEVPRVLVQGEPASKRRK
jgi:hypothetical protein